MALIDQTPQEIARALWAANLLDAVKAVEEETSAITVVKDAQGRKGQWIEETRDMDGNVLSKRVDTYSYHETGEVDTINQKTYRGESTLRFEQDVKHFTDSKVRSEAITKLEFVTNRYYGITSDISGTLVAPKDVTIILPEKATVSKLSDKGEPDGSAAYTVTTYAEKDIYDEETGEVIGTKPITIPGKQIFVTLEVNGDYVLSGELQEDVAIVYVGEIKVEK